MIAGTIYVRDQQGNNWLFCDCVTYEAFIEDPGSFDHENDPCAELIQKQRHHGNNTECEDHWYQCKVDPYSDGRQANMFLLHSYVGGQIGTEVTAEILHYKRKNNGKWKRSRAHLGATVYGVHLDTRCEFRIGFNHAKWPSSKRKRVTSFDWTGRHDTFENKQVRGYWGYSGNSFSMDLDSIDGTMGWCTAP